MKPLRAILRSGALVLLLSAVAAAQGVPPTRTVVRTVLNMYSSATHERPMVRIDNLGDPYWTRLLVAARRMTP